MRKGVLILAAILAVSAASKVDTLVFAPWTSSSHSELMEAAYALLTTFMHSEFFAVEGERDMFAFLEEAGKASILSESASTKSEWIRSYCQQRYSASTCDLLHLSLKSR